MQSKNLPPISFDEFGVYNYFKVENSILIKITFLDSSSNIGDKNFIQFSICNKMQTQGILLIFHKRTKKKSLNSFEMKLR